MRRFLLSSGLVLSALVTACVSGTETPPGTPAAINISSNITAAGVFVGDQVQLNAVPIDINGDQVDVPVTYVSLNTNLATITSTGLITALGPGMVQFNLTAQSAQAQLTLTIDGNVSDAVTVTPQTATVKVGGQEQYSFSVMTTIGNPARGKSVTWSTADGTKAQVSTTGLASAIAATSGVKICAVATDNASATGCGTLTITP
jgi:hypothetical protein